MGEGVRTPLARLAILPKGPFRTEQLAGGDVAVAGSEVVLFELENLSSATNHNGGALHFGSDGLLYIAVGENANPSNAQTLSNKLGENTAHQQRRQHSYQQPIFR